MNFDDALRELYLLAVEPNLRLEDKVAKLLALGTEALGLELGIVSRVNDPVYECIFVHGPEWAPNPGAIFDVSGTYCLHTLHNDHVTAFHHAGQQEISSHPCYQNFRLESYIGAPLKRGSEYFGTLNFSSRVERDAPFSESQVEFVGFMSRWLGNELKLQTERRELREQRGLFSAVIDAVPDAIILVDPDRQIALANQAVTTLFGYEPAQLLGRQTAVLYETLEGYERAGAERFNPQAPNKQGKFEISCRRSDGSTFEGFASTAKVETARGEHLGFLAVVRDVSEERAFERTKDQLIATVSHDLKNPLAALSGALEMLGAKLTGDDGAVRKLLHLALRNAQAIEHMIADILDVEQLRAQDQPDFTERPLAPLLVQAIETLSPYARSREVELAFKHSNAPNGLLRLHEGRVLRLISNLLSNAIKASDKGMSVEVGLSETGCGFWVKDQGAGMPPDLQNVLFERFSRGNNYRVKEGHGLGMSIAKAIVDQHLGNITFETAEGEGTTFFVKFPALSSE